MMLGEECESAAYWKQCGDDALENGVKGIIMVVNLPRGDILIESNLPSGCPQGCSQ